MPIFRDKDFDKMASEIVDKYVTGKTKLADAAAEMAMQNQMNPDQIQQLVQAANTMTFLRLMEQQKQQGGQDLMGEFDPINGQQVMQSLLSGQGGQNGMDPSMMAQMGGQDPSQMGQEGMDPSMMGGGDMEVPDQMGALRKGKKPKDADGDGEVNEEMTGKSDGKDKKPNKPEPKKQEKNKKEAGIMLMRKVASTLKDEHMQLQHEFTDKFAALVKRFKGIYAPSYSEFEKDAMAAHDSKCVPVLNQMRKELRVDGEVTSDEYYKTAMEHLGDNTVEVTKFAELMELMNKVIERESALEYLHKEIGEYL